VVSPHNFPPYRGGSLGKLYLKIFKPQKTEGRLRYLLPKEVGRLIDCCPSAIRPMVITAVCTGLRKGEIVHIKWNDIDFANRIIFIANTKDGEKREVPVNDFLTATLKSIKKHDARPANLIIIAGSSVQSPSGRSAAWFSAPALGAGGRRFESSRPDQ